MTANTTGTAAASRPSDVAERVASGRSPPSMRFHRPSPRGIPRATAIVQATSCDTISAITV
jgi:hypothetical protein